jgi:protein tyrosine/serine phosphatase
MFSSGRRFVLCFTLCLTTGATLTPALASGDAEAGADAPIDRFRRVDARLYRGAQPDAEGFRYLQQLGVRTVINLREEADAVRTNERRIVESLGMTYVSLPVKDGSIFTASRRIPEETVRTFLDLVVTTAPGPIFVHCRRGTDRTGALVGLYRIAQHGWSGAEAQAEARQVGMRWWYSGLKRQIAEFGGTARSGSLSQGVLPE